MRARVLVLLLLASAAASCTSQRERNLESARKAFDRLQIGMSHEDACWFGGFSPPPADKPDWSYSTDFGRTFSQKEVSLKMWVRGGTLVRVILVLPKYSGRTRQGEEGEIVQEKGATEAELAAMPFQ